MATETTLFKGSDEDAKGVDVVSSSTSLDDEPPSTSHVPPAEPAAGKEKLESVYKTKTMQFLGRTTPIVLQNENGPCPLLAICNVLLLRNNLNLSSDVDEVSQERLLSLIAERLIDSNSNVTDKEAGYIENQQQNVADAIDLLPRLSTGIDVNIKFRRIDDFEFTPECAIFDLLDIPLYHGWIVDPQDVETATAIGSKSYNALTGELVALETLDMVGQTGCNIDDDCVDFAAAATAVLGVPSPSLSKTTSFDESSLAISSMEIGKKGDLEEEAELLRVLKLSEADTARPTNPSDTTCFTYPTSSNSEDQSSFVPSSNITLPDPDCHFNVFDLGGENFDSSDANKHMVEMLQSEVPATFQLPDMAADKEDSQIHQESVPCMDSRQILNSRLDGSEPLYEGEEKIIDSESTAPPGEEPMYEGEIILAKQLDTTAKITSREGELITNFLKSSANQLTIFGLFCLQEGLKERELCVFFRNNHFSTMFKYEGQLYLLATDQGYITEPDLVWEKLNEVNGDSLFMTSTFKEFKTERDANATWNEQNALTNTADYLASIDNAGRSDLDMNSDLQLAIALQQQEFEQQQQPPRNNTPPPTITPSRLITGPQRPSSSGRTSSSSKPDSKLKDKCIVM